MKTVHKLILKSYLGPMVLTFFIVMFVLLMQFTWRYIDELVGKGLPVSVIGELMFYVSITLIPMALPLATLLAAIMTMGDLGENNELLALKSAGVSLPRIIRPLAIVIFVIAVASFFVANNLVPYSTKKMYSIIYDIRQQKQSLEFKDGVFFNNIENLSIRIGRQHPISGRLDDILMYDTRKRNGDMMTTIADSGYIKISDDKKFLVVTLYNGDTYEESRNRTEWYDNSTLRHSIFDRQNMMVPLEGFSMERTNDSLFSSGKTKNIKTLSRDIDSLQITAERSINGLNSQFLSGSIFVYNREMTSDTIPRTKREILNLSDSIANLKEIPKAEVISNALRMAVNAKSYLNYDEESTKQAVTQLYKSEIEWHRMLSLPISIMIFFLIGAPLGAIIRKGGLGLPIVVSIIFFVIYYIISLTGEKMAAEGTWSSARGMWLSTSILLPIAVFLTYKATNDSNLFNMDWYRIRIKKIKTYIQSRKNEKFSNINIKKTFKNNDKQ